MILRVNAVLTNDPNYKSTTPLCKSCLVPGAGWFWHCKVGVGLATCLNCQTLTSIKDGEDTNPDE